MSKPNFVYVTYISTTAEKVWEALTKTDVTSRYWRGVTAAGPPWENLSDWKPGSPWQQRLLDEAKTVGVVGRVLESTPPRRLVLTWARPQDAEDSARSSRVTFDIEPQGEGLVKLTVLHEDLDQEMHQKIGGGWPQVLSNLKTLLETGHTLVTSQDSPAVAIALAHIDAWSHHDWEKTRDLLAPDVHATVTTTQPGFGDADLRGVDNYMAPKTKAARLIEPRSVQVLSAIGDERSALVAITFKIGLGPGGAMVTMARSCLYSIDENKKIKEERDAFFLLSQ
jgi:uncharacterized protein YndB with AHSA1/START domain